jgi:hypothetical protein
MCASVASQQWNDDTHAIWLFLCVGWNEAFARCLV